MDPSIRFTAAQAAHALATPTKHNRQIITYLIFNLKPCGVCAMIPQYSERYSSHKTQKKGK
jgi:hypothetical protein